MLLPAEVRARWLTVLTRADPADRPAVERALRDLYAADGRVLRHVLWCASPYPAAWAVALLTAPHHFLWAQLVAQADRSRRLRPMLQEVQSSLQQATGSPSWEA